MALTNQEELADRMRRLSSHGITRDKDIMNKVPKDEIWNYQQVDLGYNYRLTDIQAALGISQISRIDDFVFRRNEIARIYNTKLMNLPVQLPWQSPSIHSSYHLYPIRIKKYKNINQKFIYNLLWDNKIAANIHYIPVHRQPYFEKLGFKKGDFPEAEKFHKEVISLPLFPSLKKNQQDLVIKTLLRAYNS
jgi:dTDP-4-amino-4,6-dideoxygalactose transaminase